MDLKNSLPSFNIRLINADLSVKPTRPQQGTVKYIRPVCCSQDDDAAVSSKSVHFNKQLIECVFTLIIAHHHIFTPCPSDCINLINENNTGSLFPCLLKQIPHPAGTNTNKHFNEIRTRHREKRHLSLTCHGLGQQGFSCSRRTDQQCAFWNFTTQGCILFGEFKEIYDFHHFLFCFIQSGHIGKCDVNLRALVKQLCFGFTNIENTSATGTGSAATHFTHHEHKKQSEHQQWKKKLQEWSKELRITHRIYRYRLNLRMFSKIFIKVLLIIINL